MVYLDYSSSIAFGSILNHWNLLVRRMECPSGIEMGSSGWYYKQNLPPGIPMMPNIPEIKCFIQV